MDSARHTREAGNPPRLLVMLGAVALVTTTGVALWLLPAQMRADWGSSPEPTRSLAAAQPPLTADPGTPSAPPSGAPTPGRAHTSRPSGYVGFVDATRNPRFDLSANARRTGIRWYMVGHLTAGLDGCSPIWDGAPGRDDLVADRIDRLRAQGGDAGLAFGGPYGPELSATCPSQARLTEAYQQMIDAFRPIAIDFELGDQGDGATVERRGVVIATLQHEAQDAGRPLGVTFTLPVTEDGLAPAHADMLRATHEAGAEIDTVNLLMRFVPGSRDNLRRLSVAARSAHAQLEQALGVGGRAGWQRMGLTPVLVSPDDLSVSEAERLLAFRSRTGLAWLSVRGARPADDVLRLLSAPTST
ncbi:glycoside hydrolase family 18 protein [Planotetraspora mira]|uniref:Chitinase n=1 Tax=Planotetraspora mira TaxID=58121 RepID=A0A8J3TJ78_9ACTN|nr:hypothetical protein [Planotetraspora mira]GII27433.1 hypothetical protein Pmi06nite_08750 [Planotetraspora mira]